MGSCEKPIIVDVCKDFSTNGKSGSASCIDVRDMPSYTRLSECRNADMLLVEKTLDMSSCMETAVCKQISPTQGSEVPSGALYREGDDLCGMEVVVCNQTSPSQASEVSSDALYAGRELQNILSARRINRQTKSSCKPQTKRAPRKCNNQANVPQLGWGMKTILKATRKKRSCFSRPARSTVWGLPGNIKQFFEQDGELGANGFMSEGVGKVRGSCQSGKTNKNGANSSTLSSVQSCGASTTRIRLKIKLGKRFDLSCPNILVPEVNDGSASASASASYLEPGSGSKKLAGNTVDKLSEEVAVGKIESCKENLDQDAVILNGQIANNHLENTTLTENSDGDAEEHCLVVPSRRLVDALIEPVNTKGMDPRTGTSPDSEVIDSIPEVQVGERQQEGLNDTDLGSKEFNIAVDNGYSESPVFENVLRSERTLGHKLPKHLKSSKVSKTKSKASESKSRKMIACRRRKNQQKLVNQSEVKGNISGEVRCEVEDRTHTKSRIDGNHKLDSAGKINLDVNKISVNVSNMDLVPGVELGEQHLSPHNAWVLCDDCHKWRRIPAALADQIEATNCAWTCKDNNDKAFADCSIPQEKSNADINAELGLSYASGEEDAYEGRKNYRELEFQRSIFPQESTFIGISSNEFLHRSCKSQTIDEIMVCHCKPPPKGQLGCGDECLNRMLNIECVQGACPCGDLCSNQQFQKRNYTRLKWFKCGKKGYGLKALEGISKGQFLIEYVGEVLDVHAYEARQREYALKGHRHFYFMTLNGSEWMVNGEICIGLFALRDIKQDEEVTFDYNYVRVFGAAAKKCYCGSPHCRGYIGGDPHNTEIIVQSDSDEEFPEPVMLTEDGEIEDGVLRPNYCDNVDMQTTRHMFTSRNLSDNSTTAIGPDGSLENESSLNPVSAISQLHSSLEMENSKGNSLSSVLVKEFSQQMEDVTSKAMPVVSRGYAVESELSDKTSSIQKLETSSTSSIGRSKSEIIEDRCGLSESHPLVKTSRINGPVKKGKIRVNAPNGLKAEMTTNRFQVSSIKHKKIAERSSIGRFEAVEEKLKELLDPNGGISKTKDATKGYLKLLLLTVASGDRINGETIQSCSNRDLSMILGALLETKSRAVLNDIINKNGLRMLHNIMKQYRQDFKKIPILRKLLKVLESLAERKILTFEHINGSPPCHGMESFRESMLSLTEHEDKKVHQIARSFRDKWIPRTVRKHGYTDTDNCRVESYRSFNSNRYSVSQNYRREQDLRPTEVIDSIRQSMGVTSSVNAGAQEGCSAPSHDVCENNGPKRRKRKSRWDQPAETNSDMLSYEHKEGKIVSRMSLQTDAVNSFDGRKNISADVPPGFSCSSQPHLGSLNVSPNSGDLALQNAGHSGFGCPSNAVIGHPKKKFNALLPVSYGVPWSVVQQYGTPHAETAECWVTAPGMPFKPFPPLPPYPRDRNDCQPSNTTNAMEIDQLAEVVQRDTSGLVSCYSDDMTPSTTGANVEDFPSHNNNHISKRVKCSPNDLGRNYFKQQEWNTSKIPRPWSRRNLGGLTWNNSRGGLCSIGVDDVPENASCRAEKD
ncbi:histone-lysine N-methyltransferase ASHH2 isoform X1 [Senna tora]|uniref:Histone-lysine N-methyltransferase ASHH2 isoform X1 n=1 Tax=Senna tora TaxID=362788 RepID=A0A834T7N8_9FABA|nr:histone-lysine N-methyltransferase ASHH2 isoform X1 [Senna tora]